jgi:hypothetical protein
MAKKPEAKKLKTPKTHLLKANRPHHDKHAPEQYIVTDIDGSVIDATGMFNTDTRQAKLFSREDAEAFGGAVENIITVAHHPVVKDVFFDGSL